MRNQHPHLSTWIFDFAAFVAVLVVGIILISAAHADPVIVQAIAGVATAYLGWRVAGAGTLATRTAGGRGRRAR